MEKFFEFVSQLYVRHNRMYCRAVNDESTKRINTDKNSCLSYPCCYCWKGSHFFACADGTKTWESIASPDIMQRNGSASFCISAVATSIYLIGVQPTQKAQSIKTFFVNVVIRWMLKSTIVNMDESPDSQSNSTSQILSFAFLDSVFVS